MRVHHSLKFYSRNREWILKFYIFGAKCTRIPLLGRLARYLANAFGRNMEAAYLLTTEEAEEIVDRADGLALGPCSCREVFRNCDNPVNTEIMLGITRSAFVEERPGDYREITSQEAKEVLRQCHERGLIHTLIKCRQDFYAICNCCTCCCVPLRLSKNYGIGDALVRDADIVRKFNEHELSHKDSH